MSSLFGGLPKSRTDTVLGDPEAARAFLQARVARFGKLTFLVSLFFYPLAVVMRGVWGTTGESGLRGAFGTRSTSHLVASAIFLLAWVSMRKGRRSTRALLLADASSTIAAAVALEMIGVGVPVWVRPDMYMVFVVSQLLVLRAAVIPSSMRRSAWISIAAVAPIPTITYFLYRANPRPPPVPSALGFAMNSCMWCLLAVIVTAVVSGTVHGLRERVREAMRLGQYTLVEKIGEGGMGVVYKARHALLRRPTAIKLLPPERAGEHNLVRFEREVQLTSMLTHPNTISVYDFGRTPEGTFYYAMEYLEGIDLQTLVEEDGPQPPGRVASILCQISAALAEAHSVGLIHRDVKPANIILCERGGVPDVVKVVDFGLVKQIGGDGSAGMQSALDQIVGTPLYLSPEAITAPSSVDGRSDLYALGAVGYLLLCGAPPFSGKTVVEVCGHHLHTKVTPPSARATQPIPADLELRILECLAKNPADRPPDAQTLRREILRSESLASWPVERATKWWADRGRALVERRSRLRADQVEDGRAVTVDLGPGSKRT